MGLTVRAQPDHKDEVETYPLEGNLVVDEPVDARAQGVRGSTGLRAS